MVLLLVKLLARINNGGFVLFCAIQELHYVHQRFHTIDLQLVDHSGLADVLLWNDESLELLGTGLDGDGQCSANRLQTPVQSQFAYHHVFIQIPTLHLSVG